MDDYKFCVKFAKLNVLNVFSGMGWHHSACLYENYIKTYSLEKMAKPNFQDSRSETQAEYWIVFKIVNSSVSGRILKSAIPLNLFQKPEFLGSLRAKSVRIPINHPSPRPTLGYVLEQNR